MDNWQEPELVNVPPAVERAVAGHPLLAQILVRRGMNDPDSIRAFLDPGLYTPASPYDLDDLQVAVDRLGQALHKGQRILIWGDFDVDGQTATTLLLTTLQDLGGQVDYHIPLRSKESHGVNLPVLREKLEAGFDLLLTCDTGISAHEAVEFARSKNVEVIISDHHDLPPVLPEALAVVNPKRGPSGHPLATLPGVGVAYELSQALYAHMGQPGGESETLDLVALGIVADLALQVGDVRYLLQRGLEKLHQPRRLGLQIMMELAEIDPSGLTEEHIGFELAPRLNALGRLGDASLAVKLLTTPEEDQARRWAIQLEGLNAQRKLITGQVYQAAQAKIAAAPELLQDAALVISQPAWPGGVIGIVASRLVERYSRPVLLISAPPGELARGSARSIPGIDISAAIAKQKDLLVGYGGHPMAAGFALPVERVPEFRKAISETVAEMIDEVSIQPVIQIDAHLQLADLSMDLITDLERLAPFGPGNPRLVFHAQGLRFEGQEVLGRNGEHLLIDLRDESGGEFNPVWWGGGIDQLPDWLQAGAALDLLYTARSRDYRGKKEVQIEWLEARPTEIGVLEVYAEPSVVEITDHRDSSHPLGELKALLGEHEDVIIWAEAEDQDHLLKQGIQSLDRYHLEAGKELLIWTIPAGGLELRAALEKVSPAAVYLFSVDPRMDNRQVFLERLLGLVKYALASRGGKAALSSLAAATAQREKTVRAGVDYLVAGGYLSAELDNEGQICFGEGSSSPSDDLSRQLEQLQTLLRETAAFRSYYTRAEAESLLEPPAGG